MIPRDPATRRQFKTGLLFASPAILGFALFTLCPLLASLHPSPDPVLRMTGSESLPLPGIGAVLWNTLVFMALSVPLTILVALALALLLNLPVRGRRFYQAVFFLPSLVPVAASALVWQWFFPWHRGLTQPGHIDIKYVLVLVSAWAAGANMILYRAAMRGIPQDLYDAADTEGAGAWQRATRVTLPALAPVIFFTLVAGVAGAFQVFAWPLLALGDEQDKLGVLATLGRPSLGWTLFLASAVCTGAVLFAGRRFLRTHHEH